MVEQVEKAFATKVGKAEKGVKKVAVEVAVAVLGPRPAGAPILRFWQGAVEMTLRLAALVCALGLIVPAAISGHELRTADIVTLVQLDLIAANVQNTTGVDPAVLVPLSKAGVGIAIAAAILVVFAEAILITIRFLNIGLLDIKIKCFLTTDILLGFTLILLMCCPAAVATYSTYGWSEIISDFEEYRSASSVRNPLAALAACAYLTVVVLLVLVVWMGIYLHRHWNKILVKRTIEQALKKPCSCI